MCSTSVPPERSKGQEGVEFLKRSTAPACPLFNKAMPGKGKCRLTFPSIWRNKTCIFTPKQTFPNNKDFASDFLKISALVFVPSKFSQHLQGQMSRFKEESHFMVLKGNHYMGGFSYTVSAKWIPDPGIPNCIFYLKKCILCFLSYSWKWCQKKFPKFNPNS